MIQAYQKFKKFRKRDSYMCNESVVHHATIIIGAKNMATSKSLNWTFQGVSGTFLTFLKTFLDTLYFVYKSNFENNSVLKRHQK